MWLSSHKFLLSSFLNLIINALVWKYQIQLIFYSMLRNSNNAVHFSGTMNHYSGLIYNNYVIKGPKTF